MVMQKGKQEEGASLKPSDAAEGGGLLDNVDVTWKESRLRMWDYNGTLPECPALRVDMELEDGDVAVQYWSLGNIAKEDYKISEDGTTLLKAVKTPRPLSKSSNFMILMESLIKRDETDGKIKRFPEDEIGANVSIFDSLECHMVRVKAPERKGLAPRKARTDGRIFESTNLVVDTIYKLPGEKKEATKEKGKADDVIAQKTTEAVIAILKANPKGLDPKKLAGQVFNKTKSMPVAQLAAKTDFLTEGAIEGNWGFEDGIVTPA